MDVQQKLAQFEKIDGFIGAALFAPEGNLLAKYERMESHIDIVGVLANNTLINAQKASMEMGYGRGQFIFIHADKALILIRCLNEGSNPIRSEPGKTHIHLVLVVDDPTSLGMAKLEINKIIETLADDFRLPEQVAQPQVAANPKKSAQPAATPKAKEKQVSSSSTQLEGAADSLDNMEIDKILNTLIDKS